MGRSSLISDRTYEASSEVLPGACETAFGDARFLIVKVTAPFGELRSVGAEVLIVKLLFHGKLLGTVVVTDVRGRANL
jgi:hypothetical protein